MDILPDDIKNKIIDFTHGDDKYWKNQYNKVMNEMNNIKQCLYCKCWYNNGQLLEDQTYRCNEELCELCDDEWGFGQHFWERYGEDRYDGIVLKYLKIQKCLDDNNID